LSWLSRQRRDRLEATDSYEPLQRQHRRPLEAGSALGESTFMVRDGRTSMPIDRCGRSSHWLSLAEGTDLEDIEYVNNGA
jgi:hypothetical protein